MKTDPSVGARKDKPGKASILCICFYDPTGIATVRENIGAWQQQSRFRIEVLNLWPGGGAALSIPPSLDIARFDGVYIHPTACYSPDNLWSLDSRSTTTFENYRGLKILAKQDEHYRSAHTAEFIGAKKVDVLLTCLPESEWRKVYPKDMVGDCVLMQTLTGYVSPAQREIAWRPMAARRVDVAYRGSMQPLSFGRLGREKWEIGERFLEAVAGRGLRTDISSEWSARFNGKSWYGFLQDSRAVLGVESGSNVFDFDGSLAAAAKAFETENRARMSRDELYRAAEERIIGEREGNVDYAQVSPRHFEAAAAFTVQVLYEGRYSDILKPWRHYLPLRRDFGNIDEIVDALRDDARLEEMARVTRAELIDAPTWHYETFVERLDDFLEGRLVAKGLAQPARNPERPQDAAEKRPRAMMLIAHDPSLDPRIDWMSASLAGRFDVLEIGVRRESEAGQGCDLDAVGPHRRRLRVERTTFAQTGLAPFLASDNALCDATQAWTLLTSLRGAPNAAVVNEFGLYADGALDRACVLADYFIDTTWCLIEAARRAGGAEVIVAVDLETLLAGRILAQEFGAKLVYDAHEYWPFSFTSFSAAETALWSAFENMLLACVAVRMTVSPPLAQMMASDYGVEFLSVPNAVPAREAVAVPARAPLADGPVDFLVQGNFADSRGYEELIDAWPATPERARLLLRGPDNAFKAEMIERARASGLLETRILFPPAVNEADLVAAAATASVGIIPYKPVNAGYRCCCPNKLSQYMASGLPILANHTEFVGPFVRENGIGAVADFSNRSELVAAVTGFVSDAETYRMQSARSQETFARDFNWETVSGDAIRLILKGVGVGTSETDFDLDWVGRDGAMDRDTRGIVEENREDAVTYRQPMGAAVVTIPKGPRRSFLWQVSEGLRGVVALRSAWKALPAPVRGFVVNRFISR